MATTASGRPIPSPTPDDEEINEELEDFRRKRSATILIVLALAAIAACIVGGYTNLLAGLAVFGIIALGFLAQGFRAFDPTTFAVPILRDQMFDGILEKWQFFPFLGLLFDYRLLDGRRKNLELPAEERTPADNGTVIIDQFFTWRVSRTHPKRFIMAGGEAAVIQMFKERAVGRQREWIRSRKEGPQTWSEALSSNGPALYVLVEKLFPKRIPPIPPEIYQRVPALRDIPPIGFVRHITENPSLPEYETDAAGKQKIPKNATALWKQESLWQKTLNELKVSNRPAWDALKAAVDNQLAFIDQVKTGGNLNLFFPIEDLGIDIVLANIAGIRAVGKTGDAADRVAEAIQDALVNGIAGQNLREEVEATLPLVGNDSKLAKELVELRRGLITKSTTDQNFGVTPDMIPLLKEIAGMLAVRRTN